MEGAAALVGVLGADDADDRHGLILHLRFDRSTEAVGHEPLASPERDRRRVREAARNLGRSRRELGSEDSGQSVVRLSWRDLRAGNWRGEHNFGADHRTLE